MASNTTVNSTNAEVFIIVWLDTDVNTTEANKKAQQQLLTIINHLKTFERKTECEKYIRSLSSQERLLLIISGQLGKELVPDIHTLPQVTSIYVYCQDKEKNEQWANRFKKVKAVITQLDQLISRIKTDRSNVLFLDEEQAPSFFAAVGETEQLKTYCTPQFAYSQLLSNVLLQMKPNETDENDLILLCKSNNKNSETKLKIIDEFQRNYSSHKALRWFSSCSVIYKILDDALKTQDINTIFLFRYFINDLHEQISKYQCKDFMKVYRSQLVRDDEINRLKESLGSFISINMFFSTTLDLNIAFQLLKECGHSNDYHRVLFRIDADPKVMKTKPFADISKQSGFPEQREVLFAIGSIFRITNIQQNDDRIWIVLMTLCSDDDPGLNSCFEDMEKRYGYSSEEATLFSFSRILRAMKKFDEAEKYCHRLLQQFATDESSLSVVYEELAEIASSKSDYDLNIQWQLKSMKITDKTEPNRGDNIVETVNYNDDNLRFTDVVAEKHEILLPIEGHEKMPLVSLEEAVIPLLAILPDIRRKVHTAKLKCKNPADGLTPDQSAAIMLYTMEWKPQDECLYCALNTRLRTADRNVLKPWFLYLKLILTGLARLPSIERTVYRGVKLDLSSEYPKDKQFFWWGFSSCTTTMNILKSEQFLGDSGMRTFFLIECKNGKDIGRHSYYKKEEEILLLPAIYLEVKSSLQMAPDLHVIQLKEIKSEYPYLEPVE